MGLLRNNTPPPVRGFTDVSALRKGIYDKVREAYASSYPIENQQYRVELTDVDYDDDEPAGYDRQKKALISGRSLHRSLSGNWRMIDKATGQVIDERRSRIAQVPHVTERGTFIYNGNEYSMANQLRLKPGVYTRRKENGELESHFNVKPGTGTGFRLYMDPDTGVFRAKIGQSKIPIYTVLKSLGVTDKELDEAWGRDLTAANRAHDHNKHLDKAFEKLTNRRAALGVGDAQPGEEVDKVAVLKAALERMELDPAVVEDTLGDRAQYVNPKLILKATRKLRDIARGTGETDDRDNIAYQQIMGPEDILAERIRKDAGHVSKSLLWKSTFRRSLDPIVNPDARNKQLRAGLLDSGLGMALEEINPLSVLDQMERVTRMGDGGIPSADSIPDESRAVQPSYLGFIDAIRTSESEKAGVDNRLAYRTLKGEDNHMYAPMIGRDGKQQLVSSADAARSVIAFPGELEAAAREDRPVRAMVRGRLKFVDPAKVDYQLPSYEDMMSTPAHLVPFLSAIKGHRMLMVSKMMTQALPMKKPEAPWVQSSRTVAGDDADDTFEKYFGSKTGVVKSDALGTVKRVTDGFIEVQTPKGVTRYELYNHLPYNRKTFVHSTPLVQPGQTVKPGQLLAKSNYTTDDGTLAMGKNLRIAYMPYKGMTHEDAIVISESAAKKLSSEHMYQHDLDLDPGQKLSKSAFVAKFPTMYSKRMLENFDDSGVIKPGTVVRKDDPLVLSVTKRQPKGQGVLLKKSKEQWANSSVTWKHDAEGVVTDVHTGPRGANVVVKSFHPVEVGDKLTQRMASKGVVSKIIPDDQMPRDGEERPLEILVHPFGVISRTNPSLILEAALGKVAAKTGKPYKVPGFSETDFVEFVEQELKKHNLSDTEDLFDPDRNAKIPKVFTGNQFWMKLHHTAEGKLAARGDEAGYTADMLPAKGGEDSSKRIGALETTSLLSHGATEILRDAKLVRGQRNDDFWRAFRMGYPPPTPEIPFVYRKFLDDLRAAGINVKKEGNYVHIMAMTDDDVDRISRGEIEKADTLDFDTMNPVSGGLFDLGKTGGHGGTGWSHIRLHEPLPNPVMEDPIRRLLGLTEKKFREVLAGKRDINGVSGSKGIQLALKNIKVDEQIDVQKQLISNGPKSKRDDAVKKLRTLDMLQKTGIKPEKLMLSKVPVLPPQYRPISRMGKMNMISDPNYLYKELLLANDNLRELSDELGNDAVGDERVTLYDTFKSVTGLGDPIQPELQQKNVRGILSHALGLRHSPKFSNVQRKVIGTSTDLVGRAVITPNSSLTMDQVGLPEEKAWKLYRPFVMRNLVRRGMSPMAAQQMIANQGSQSREELVKEMERRPVIINRAPTLHRFGIMAAYPVLTKGKTLQVPPLTTGGFGADFDGDTEQFHVPVSDEAVEEAIEKMLPSKNLLDVKGFKAHYIPNQEFLHGLFAATHKSSGKPVRVFKTKKDVERAYRLGEINIDDPVKVSEAV